MNDTNNTNTNLAAFDLEDASKEEFEEFADDLGEVVMQRILRKAWVELDATKRDTLIDLLESSEADPEDAGKQEAVFAFLDANISNLPEFVSRELESIQHTYRESRDQIRDLTE